MKRFILGVVLSICLTVAAPAAVFAAAFTYEPPGDLVAGSGNGRVDYKVYLPDMRFPVEKVPAYANSQVWGVGGMYGPGGSQCDADNYSYPWRDNYCEKRSWDMPLCPSGTGHQGQDIRPSTCADSKHYAVATEGGTITYIGSYSVNLQGDSGIRHSYLHLNHGNLSVWVGKRVEKGAKIGKISDNMGSTPTTIHLHFTMKSGGVYIPTYMSLVTSYKTLLGISDAVKRSAVAHGADFDGDKKDDIFWYAAGSASDYIWYGTGRNTWANHSMNIYGNYVPIAGDFDGDGNSDIFWYAAGDASDWIYYGEGRNGEFRVESASVQGTYIPISGDFNGDGRTDIFWYGPSSSSDSIWIAQSSGGFKSYSAGIWGIYKPIAGDFDGDGKDDIFWYAAGDAADWIYYGTDDPANGFRVVSTAVKGTYTPISGDFNGDGRDDVLWYGPGANFDALWLAQGSGFKYYAITVVGIYRPVKGDFDGDGISDIFWYGVGGAVDNMWFGNPDHTFKWMAAKAVNGTYIPIP